MTVQSKKSRRIMEEAIAQRTPCFLSLPAAVTGLAELRCAILEASSRGLLLESAGKAAAGPHWLGLGVKGYFRVTLGKNSQEPDFYTFDSRIRAAGTGPGGRARLRLDEPEGVVFGQRRKSLRVQPECERLRKVFLWRYDNKEGLALDAPALKGGDFQSGLARLSDISAGGLRLTLRAALVAQRDLDLTAGDRVVVHLELEEPRVAGTHTFWIVARIRHAGRDCVSRDLNLGIEFLASGRLDPKVGKIRWQPVHDNVIPGLADIFFYWHLDKHREMLG